FVTENCRPTLGRVSHWEQAPRSKWVAQTAQVWVPGLGISPHTGRPCSHTASCRSGGRHTYRDSRYSALGSRRYTFAAFGEPAVAQAPSLRAKARRGPEVSRLLS